MSSGGNGTSEQTVLGRHIVADPEVCHGQPTFLGTRIMVSVVLRQLRRGMSTDAIIQEWRGKVPAETIAEAVMRG